MKCRRTKFLVRCDGLCGFAPFKQRTGVNVNVDRSDEPTTDSPQLTEAAIGLNRFSRRGARGKARIPGNVTCLPLVRPCVPFCCISEPGACMKIRCFSWSAARYAAHCRWAREVA